MPLSPPPPRILVPCSPTSRFILKQCLGVYTTMVKISQLLLSDNKYCFKVMKINAPIVCVCVKNFTYPVIQHFNFLFLLCSCIYTCVKTCKFLSQISFLNCLSDDEPSNSRCRRHCIRTQCLVVVQLTCTLD